MEKRTEKYIYITLASLLVISIVTAGYQYRTASAMKLSVENNYNRAFHELVDYVDGVETLLEKSMLVSSSAQISSISSELFRQTTAAKACLAQLPVSEVVLEKTEKFLSQIGDYTYMLSQKSIYNEEITEEEYNNLSKLGEYAKSLNAELLKMQQDIYNGNISFGEIGKKTNEGLQKVVNAAGNNILSGFENVEKQFQEYPSLIYDGPFSEHIESINPVMTDGAKAFSKEEAETAAKAFFEDFSIVPVYDGESENTPLASYLYRGTAEDKSLYAAFTKKGCFPLYFLINREMGEEKITVDDAIFRAKEFLRKNGYASMKESYYEKANGCLTVNFAYSQGNVVCYSDLIKVKVALDNGEITGMEANGYLYNHKIRNVNEPKLNKDDVKKLINKHLTPEEINLAIIPKESKNEVTCYEVKGNYNDRNFLIYINADNGREEQILMLIESENGTLAV